MGRPKIQTTCTQCGAVAVAHSLCVKHYQRQRRASGRGCRVPVPPCSIDAPHAWTSVGRCIVCNLERAPARWV